MTTRARSLLLVCAAATGLVGAHVLDYRFTFPNSALRRAVLDHTGHGYLREAFVVAATAAVLGLAGSVIVGYRRRAIIEWRSFALRLASVQVAGFVLLEVAERIAAGVNPWQLVGRVGLIGVALQVVVACFAAVLLAAIGGVAGVVGDVFEKRPDARPVSAVSRFIPLLDGHAPRLLYAGTQGARGPPLPPR
jgi:hypothetical protein